MKAYLITTGGLFGLITLAHLWRMVDEGSVLATDPWYLSFTVAAAALSVWAWRLLRLSTRKTSGHDDRAGEETSLTPPG